MIYDKRDEFRLLPRQAVAVIALLAFAGWAFVILIGVAALSR